MRFIWDWHTPDFHRFWLHFPIGAGGAAMTFIEPVVGVTAMAMFVLYEAFNDWRKQDKSYKDIIGGAFGFWACAAIWLICR